VSLTQGILEKARKLCFELHIVIPVVVILAAEDDDTRGRSTRSCRNYYYLCRPPALYQATTATTRAFDATNVMKMNRVLNLL